MFRLDQLIAQLKDIQLERQWHSMSLRLETPSNIFFGKIFILLEKRLLKREKMPESKKMTSNELAWEQFKNYFSLAVENLVGEINKMHETSEAWEIFYSTRNKLIARCVHAKVVREREPKVG